MVKVGGILEDILDKEMDTHHHWSQIQTHIQAEYEESIWQWLRVVNGLEHDFEHGLQAEIHYFVPLEEFLQVLDF